MSEKENNACNNVTVTQLRFEWHPSVHKLYLNMWGEQNIADNSKNFCVG